MASDRAWTAALTEHDAVVRDFLDAIRQIPDDRWHRESRVGKWTPAEEALHVAVAYEFGSAAVTVGTTMRMIAPPAGAWIARRLLLPLLLATRTFPRGAAAPPEVQPSLTAAMTLTSADAVLRVRQAASDAGQALRAADARRPVPRVTHAYFGSLSPYEGLRLLSAHTRHHARRMSVVRSLSTITPARAS